MKILLIDDVVDDAQLAIDELRRNGLQFEERIVSRRDEIHDALLAGGWDAIVSDFNLAGFTGLDVIRDVRARDPHVPILIVSGAIGEERAAALVRAGANDYVSKNHLSSLAPAVTRELRDAELNDERRRLEALLAASEHRYRRMLDAAPIGVFNSDETGRYLAVNERFCQMTGYTRDEIIGQHWWLLAAPTDLPKIEKVFAGAVGGNEPVVEFERAYRRKDGSRFSARVTVSVDRNHEGALVSLVGLVEDISARVSAEDRVRLQAHLLDSVEQAVIAVDRGWNIIYWNSFAERLYGWSADEVVGLRLNHVLHAAWDPDHLSTFRQQLLEGQSWAGEIVLQHRDGTAITAWVANSPILDAEGTMIGVVGISHDMSEQKKAADDLRDAKIALDQAQDLAALGSWTYDFKSRETKFSDGLRRLFDLDASTVSLTQEDFFARVHPDDRERVDTIYRTAVATRQSLRAEFRLLRNGLTRTMDTHVHFVADADGTPAKVIAIVQDISDRTAVEAELRRQAVERERADAEAAALARQQVAIGRLGRMVVSAVHDEIFDSACKLMVESLGTEAGFYAEAGDETNAEDILANALSVPVVSGGTVHGVLTTQSREERHFTPSEVAFVETIASMLAETIDRENARLKLLESEDRYHRIFEGASEIIFTVDANGTLVQLNSAFEAITGWSRAEWIGRSFSELIVAEDVGRLMRLFEEMLAGNQWQEWEANIQGNGKNVRLEGVTFPHSVNGVVSEVYGFARDVTEARRNEQERSNLTRHVELLLESTVEGIYAQDLSGRCTMINRAAAETLQLSRDEIIGRPMHEVIHSRRPDGSLFPRAECPIHSVLEHGLVVKRSNEAFWRSDATAVPVDYTAAPIVDEGVVIGAVVTFTDITERRQLESRLEQANRLSSLGRLAATVAHEFNNVLMGISPFVEVLRRKAVGPNVGTALDSIAKSVTRGRRISEEILRFTQPAEPVRANVSLSEWLGSFLEETESLLPAGVRLLVDVPRDLTISGDLTQLHQIFTNLVLNARDAMPRGGEITISARTERRDATFAFGSVANPHRYAHVIVRDTGCGMPESTLRHVFEPLFTTKRSGTGLGLAVTHQVVSRHGGEIFVESIVDEGTTFHIFLPLVEAVAEDVANEMVASRANGVPGMDILVVEDDAIVASGLRTLLESEGFIVHTAETGARAVETLLRRRPDAVLLDVGLPDMDGRDLYQRIAESAPRLPVIFSSGHGDRAALEDVLKRPEVRYLMKPYDIDSLLEALSTVLEPQLGAMKKN